VAQTQAACEYAFHWYGAIVNINPCLFNFVVHAYERLIGAGIRISGNEANDFRTIPWRGRFHNRTYAIRLMYLYLFIVLPALQALCIP
jgi:hypothetical protein